MERIKVPGCHRSARWMVFKAFARSWKSTIVLAGLERRVALMVGPISSAKPDMPTQSCSGGSDGPASGRMLMQSMAAKRSHASQMAMGRMRRATPLLFKRASTGGIMADISVDIHDTSVNTRICPVETVSVHTDTV
jgi:hypothetical protein